MFKWVRPPNYKPATHLKISGTFDDGNLVLMCGTNKSRPPKMYFKYTDDCKKVTCKGCLNSLILRKYKIIAYIVAILWYVRWSKTKEDIP